jgi:hypothetical protein
MMKFSTMKSMVIALGLMAALVLSNAPVHAQKMLRPEDRAAIHKTEDTLAILAFSILRDSLPEGRFAACRQFIPILVRALKTPHSFEYAFERLNTISIQYPRDSSFRIFTWQLYVDENDYRYFGAIQMNTPELKLFPLVDRSQNLEGEDLEQAVLSPENWYGVLYYNLYQVDQPRGNYYLLFGYDAYRFYQKRKLIDVLRFDRDGKPVFGAPVFVHRERGMPPTKNRVLLQYSSESTVRLNYDEELKIIIFDHLIEMAGFMGEGANKYPDGSYEGYRLENGLWRHIPKVWDQVSDEPPRPFPILDTRKKDILGRN